MKRRIISLLAALALLLGLLPLTAAAEAGDIVVLYTNDVHCGVDTGVGYAGLAALEKAISAETGYITLVDAGDAVQGEALGSLSQGAFPIAIMNELGFDAAVPGNHEFDYGMTRFLELSEELDCGYICCNLIDLKTGLPVFDAYRIVRYGDTEVAYLGIVTPSALTSSTPAYFMDESGAFVYGFCSGDQGRELYAAVQSAIDAAKAEGADYVIAVGHCGIAEDDAPWRSTDVIENVSGLDAFIDGHSHSVIPAQSVTAKDGKTVLLTSTGTKLANVGRLVITAGGSLSASLVSAAEQTERDAAAGAFIKEIQAENEALLKTIVASSAVDLSILAPGSAARAVRRRETNLGDLVADAYRAVCGADIGLANGGGVRVSIPAGEISYEQLISAQPFGNAICMARVTGRQVMDALEFGAQYVPYESGSFLQVSGLEFTVDTSVSTPVTLDEAGFLASIEGERRVKDILVGGLPIDPDVYYTVASNDYLLVDRGGGCTVFDGCELLLDSVMLDNEALIAYISKELGGVVPAEYAESQGRIRVTGEPFADVAPENWFYSGVSYAYNACLLFGSTETAFSPAAAMTASAFWEGLARMDGKPIFGDGAPEAAAAWAEEKGLAAYIGRDDVLPREGLAYALWHMAGSPEAEADLSAYADADAVSPYAAEAVEWAVGTGLLRGTSEAALSPLAPVTRAQAATVMLRCAAA